MDWINFLLSFEFEFAKSIAVTLLICSHIRLLLLLLYLFCTHSRVIRVNCSDITTRCSGVLQGTGDTDGIGHRWTDRALF